jgi:hypothetical protein
MRGHSSYRGRAFTVRAPLAALALGVSLLGQTAVEAGVTRGSTAAHVAGPVNHDIEAAGVIEELQRYYRDNAVCDNVQVSVRSFPAGQPPRVSRATFRLRYELARGLEGAASVATLELGSLILQAEGSRALLAHARDPGTYVERSLTAGLRPQSLAEVVPPTPIPQLDLALLSTSDATSNVCDQFWPYASGIVWRRSETDARSPNRRTVRGDFNGGTVILRLLGPRLQTIEITRHNDRVEIILSFKSATPCDPRRKLIDTSSRTKASSITELRPKSMPLLIGERIPDMGLSLASGNPMSIPDLLEPPPEAVIVGMPPAEHAVLLFSRVGSEAPAERGAGVQQPESPTRLKLTDLVRVMRQTRSEAFSARAVAGAADGGDPLPRFGYALVLAFNQHSPDTVLRELDDATQVWGGQNVLWAASSERSIELIAPGAESAAVIVDSRGIVRSVIPVTGSSSADSLRDQVLMALFELGAPRGMAPFVMPTPVSAPASPQPGAGSSQP